MCERRNPDLVDFALSETLLAPATQYLGMVPYLTRVDLVYSVSRGTDEKIESQLFHLDHEGLRQLKYFIYLYDVGEPEGPFTFLPAETSFRVVNDVRAWRKRHGGTLFGLWPYAASGLASLRRRLPLMPKYFAHARAIAAALRGIQGVEIVPDPPQTPAAEPSVPPHDRASCRGRDRPLPFRLHQRRR